MVGRRRARGAPIGQMGTGFFGLINSIPQSFFHLARRVVAFLVILAVDLHGAAKS